MKFTLRGEREVKVDFQGFRLGILANDSIIYWDREMERKVAKVRSGEEEKVILNVLGVGVIPYPSRFVGGGTCFQSSIISSGCTQRLGSQPQTESISTDFWSVWQTEQMQKDLFLYLYLSIHLSI